jgi:uncharacterized protein (AIM24 family)
MNTTRFESARVPDDENETFRLENSYTLDATVEGSLLAKAGSMVAYTGDLSFTGQTSAEGGLTGVRKEAATGEGTPVMAVEGTGTVFLADRGKKVRILALDAGDAITVNGADVLAFESTVDYEVGTIDSLAGSIAGGVTNAWSGTTPNVEVNRSRSDMVGQESGERYQMEFAGADGFVVVQPYEEL